MGGHETRKEDKPTPKKRAIEKRGAYGREEIGPRTRQSPENKSSRTWVRTTKRERVDVKGRTFFMRWENSLGTGKRHC